MSTANPIYPGYLSSCDIINSDAGNRSRQTLSDDHPTSRRDAWRALIGIGPLRFYSGSNTRAVRHERALGRRAWQKRLLCWPSSLFHSGLSRECDGLVRRLPTVTRQGSPRRLRGGAI